MTNSRGSVEGASILAPQDVQRLRQACPDLHDWPRSWHVEPTDIAVGQQIVSLLTPLLLHLLDLDLTKTPQRRHRDNLWSLGGELIWCRYDDDQRARLDIKDALQQLIGNDGGPLIWPRFTESEQDSLDATCRKLYRFMRNSDAAGKSLVATQTPPPMATSNSPTLTVLL